MEKSELSLLDSDDEEEEITQPTDKTPQEYVIGIDLGTSNSCVSIWRNKCLEVIPDEYGNRTVPSVVAFTNKTRYIGVDARNQIEFNPENSYYDIKRLIGRKFSDTTVTNDREFFTFEVSPDKNDSILIKSSLQRRKQTYTPEELCSMILAKLKSMAESYLQTEITKAVITVPAYFNDAQRQATKDASTIAGLDCIRVLNEPTAAALAYGLKSKTETNILVYDNGAGTVDASVLNISDGVFQVLACTGNTHLGGEDFDNRLVNHSINSFKKKHNILDLENLLSSSMQKLKKACENAKKTLSVTGKAIITVNEFYDNKNLYLTITRKKFEELCQDLFILCMKPVDDVLRSCGVEKKEIDEIVLVGGSTRMPKIKEMLTTYFGKTPNDTVNPDEVVSAGAAIQGYILANQDDPFSSSIVLLDVTPLSLGIETTGGLMNVLIPRNSAMPITKRRKFTTDTDKMDKVTVNVYEGERKLVTDNFKVGTFELSLDPAQRGVPEIEITFAIDVNGIINVTAIDKKNELNKNSIMITSNKGRLTLEEIKQLVTEAKKHEIDDKLIRDKKMLQNELEEICHNILCNLEDNSFNLKDSDKHKISEDIKQVVEFIKNDTKKDKREYGDLLKRLRKSYAVLVLRANKSFDSVKAQETSALNSTSVYGNEEDDEILQYEGIANEFGLDVNKTEDIKKTRNMLTELCYSVFETLSNPPVEMKPDHVTELKDYIDDVLLWVHIKEKLTEKDYIEKIDEVNNNCNTIMDQYSNTPETEVITSSRDELEQLCFGLKCGIQNNMFSINEDASKKLLATVEEYLVWLEENTDAENIIYVIKQQELNQLCDEYYQSMTNLNLKGEMTSKIHT